MLLILLENKKMSELFTIATTNLLSLFLNFIVFSVGALVMGYYLVYQPTLDELSETNEKLQKAEHDLGVLKNDKCDLLDELNKAHLLEKQRDTQFKLLQRLTGEAQAERDILLRNLELGDYKDTIYTLVLNKMATLKQLLWVGDLPTVLGLYEPRHINHPKFNELAQLKLEIETWESEVRAILLPQKQVSDFEQSIKDSGEFMFERVLIPIAFKDALYQAVIRIKNDYQLSKK
jgi:hypothetical protein